MIYKASPTPTKKVKILGMVRAMKSFENVYKHNIEEWLQSDACEVGFQYVTDIVDNVMKQKG
jgi:hypothetical protein